MTKSGRVARAMAREVRARLGVDYSEMIVARRRVMGWDTFVVVAPDRPVLFIDRRVAGHLIGRGAKRVE